MKIDLNQYLGEWFEIARIKNDFEPNMTNVKAIYSLNDDNTIRVINSGYINGELKQIIGKAIPTNRDDILKLSFFNNAYSNYNILAIDKNYQYSLVGGNSKNYLWILSRTKSINKNVLNKMINIAKEKGYNTDKLIITK
ncbi:MAG: lipocalin family protein [Bacilli bacterium]|nr:lipocalin family protein [Bacilli bacterium]